MRYAASVESEEAIMSNEEVGEAMSTKEEIEAMSTKEEGAMSTSESEHCTCSCCQYIGLEPVLFIQNIVSQLVYVTSQDLMVEKACKVNHGLPYTTCDNLPNDDYTDETIHDQVSEFIMWRDIFEASIKFVVVLFIGPWSDKYGRRYPLMICLLLLMMESVMMLINAQKTQWPLEMMLLSSIPYGLSGGHYSLLMLSFSHVAHTSSKKKRTFRMGFLDTFWYFGKTIGLLLKPVIKENSGYVGVFTTSIILYLIAAGYVFVRLRNEETRETIQVRKSCGEVCSLDHMSSGVHSIVRPRQNRDRLHIIVLVCVMILDAFAAQGEGSVKYLFVLRAVGWTSSHYSYWSALTSLLSVVGAFILIPAITLLCVMADPLIGILGASSRLAANLCYAPVNTPGEDWLLYLGSVLASFSVLAPVAVRSLLSKIAQDEIGSIFGAMAAAETLVLFLSGPLYTSVYNATNSHHPGVYNLVSAVIHSAMIAGFGIVLKWK